MRGIPSENYGQARVNVEHSGQNYGYTLANKGHSTLKLWADVGRRRTLHVKIMGTHQ